MDNNNNNGEAVVRGEKRASDEADVVLVISGEEEEREALKKKEKEKQSSPSFDSEGVVEACPSSSKSIIEGKNPGENPRTSPPNGKQNPIWKNCLEGKKWKVLVFMEGIALICIIGCLIAILKIRSWHHFLIWGFEIWKWCVFVMIIICGRLFAWCLIELIFIMIEKNLLLGKKEILYFVHGLRKSVRICIWLGLLLLSWSLLFNLDVDKRSRDAKKIHMYVSRTLVSCLVGSVIWSVKTLLLKQIEASFLIRTFFERIQESIFHQYIVSILSKPPLETRTGQLNIETTKNIKKKKGREEIRQINPSKLQQQKHVSPWQMTGLIAVIKKSDLSSILKLKEKIDGEEGTAERNKKEISNESDVKDAAQQIFKNIVKDDNKNTCIEEKHLLRFFDKADVDKVLPKFEGADDTRKIKRTAFRNWLVNVYHDHKSLIKSLNGTKTIIKKLNQIISMLVIVVIVIVWLLLMGFATTQVLILISSQLLVLVFMFGNTAKILFESIIFVFVTHPFDVGDRCVINGVQMTVQEMHILTTVFLSYDNEKIYYPNSVLATKSIINFNRSPCMGDSVDFSIDVSTTMANFKALKDKIKTYIDNKPKHWRIIHSIVVKEIEDVHKMKITLYVTHTMNYQNIGERNNRRSALVIKLKNIFEELSIKYHLLPQEVHLSDVGSATTVPMNIE